MLRWYQARELDVTPVHPVCIGSWPQQSEFIYSLFLQKEPELEGVKTVSQLSELASPKETSVSIVTPPKVRLCEFHGMSFDRLGLTDHSFVTLGHALHPASCPIA